MSQAVPARAAAPQPRQGRRPIGAAIPDARADRRSGPKRVTRGTWLRPFESGHRHRHGPRNGCIRPHGRARAAPVARFIEDKSALATARANTTSTRTFPSAVEDRPHLGQRPRTSSATLLVDEALGMLTYYANPYILRTSAASNEDPQTGRISRTLTLPRKPVFAT